MVAEKQGPEKPALSTGWSRRLENLLSVVSTPNATIGGYFKASPCSTRRDPTTSFPPPWSHWLLSFQTLVISNHIPSYPQALFCFSRLVVFSKFFSRRDQSICFWMPWHLFCVLVWFSGCLKIQMYYGSTCFVWHCLVCFQQNSTQNHAWC